MSDRFATSPRRAAALLAGVAVAVVLAAPAVAACNDGGAEFGPWLVGVRSEAVKSGVPAAAVDRALAGVTFDPQIIRRDRGQGVFQQSFLQFSDRMVSKDRLSRGPRQLAANADLLRRVERAYGVPGEVLVAFWGLETDFGADKGKYDIIRSLATLSYDCRRADFFRPQLIAAIRLVAKGDLTHEEMVGDWAGEAGHLMMSAGEYDKWGVDFDGDGKRNVIKSLPDAFASAAAFLAGAGWKRGEPWLDEVRVPARMPWEESGLDRQHTRAEWARWGVTGVGKALPADGMKASLHLPMGRNGPAFLAYDNFQAFLTWNKAIVYATTAAYYANRLDGAPPVGRGNAPVTPLTTEEVRELQMLLHRHGFSDEPADGRVGTVTRAASREAQLKLGLPADAYPDQALLVALRGLR
jgi:lytic murein transglycosylase